MGEKGERWLKFGLTVRTRKTASIIDDDEGDDAAADNNSNGTKQK